MSQPVSPASVAVIGAGLAGAACAASLHQAGMTVTLFDKSRGVGGRLATRRARWTDASGQAHALGFDHGAQLLSARRPRFKALLTRAEAAGVLLPWRARVSAAWPAPQRRTGWVPAPDMPAFARHLLGDLPVHLGQAVTSLQRVGHQWQLLLADGSVHGPFTQVMLALPPAQAAALLAPHQADWSQALADVAMQPCWTLMAVTPDVDWPWDIAEPATGPLAWVSRQDRRPGRAAAAGQAQWVAHASAAWSQAHLEDDADTVADALRNALAALLPDGRKTPWQHSVVHRWRYASPAADLADGCACWWDSAQGLGLCGDFLGGPSGPDGDVALGAEAAWCSGDELADTLLAALDPETAGEPAAPPPARTGPHLSLAPALPTVAAPAPQALPQPQPALTALAA